MVKDSEEDFYLFLQYSTCSTAYICPQKRKRVNYSNQVKLGLFKVMKVKTSVKKRSVDCKIIRRNGKLYVINKKNPRFKQRQG